MKQRVCSDAVVSDAFNTGLVAPGPHRVLRSAIAAAEALPDETVATLRLAGAEVPVPRFGPQPPTRDSTGEIAALALYAGQSAGAVHAVMPAADIVAELATGVPEGPSRGHSTSRRRSRSAASPANAAADATRTASA